MLTGFYSTFNNNKNSLYVAIVNNLKALNEVPYILNWPWLTKSASYGNTNFTKKKTEKQNEIVCIVCNVHSKYCSSNHTWFFDYFYVSLMMFNIPCSTSYDHHKIVAFISNSSVMLIGNYLLFSKPFNIP